MNEKSSVNKEILCMMDEFIQFKSTFEMLSDASLDATNKNMNPRMFLVQDSIGSEFMEFFMHEIVGKFPIQEIICKSKKLEKQLEEISEIFDENDESEKPAIDKFLEEEKENVNVVQNNTNLLGKTILFK